MKISSSETRSVVKLRTATPALIGSRTTAGSSAPAPRGQVGASLAAGRDLVQSRCRKDTGVGDPVDRAAELFLDLRNGAVGA